MGSGATTATVIRNHLSANASRNPVIGDRAFGTTPEAVAAQAVTFFVGLEASGVRGCDRTKDWSRSSARPKTEGATKRHVSQSMQEVSTK